MHRKKGMSENYHKNESENYHENDLVCYHLIPKEEVSIDLWVTSLDRIK